MYTLLQNKFTVLSTETIAEIGADISTHNTQFFKDHKAGALKLNTFFLDKQFQIKQRGYNTCMVDFVWHNCRGKKGFQKYTYQKLGNELKVYAPSFLMMSTQELVTWAKECHPNVSIHAYDSTWRKFMKHIASTRNDVCLVFYIKDHHLYPIQDNNLRKIAKQANQGGTDNLWRYMSELKWSNRSSNYIKYQQLVDNADADIVKQKNNKTTKPTLLTIENHVIILPEDMKIEYVIEQYMIRTNYFVEYLHYDNNGRLDGFMDHKHNMYILNNDFDIRKEICRKLFKMYKTHDFIWCNQSYTALASSMFKHMRGYLPESQYDTKTREVLDDFYPRALQWCTDEEVPEFVTSLDICKCYPSILINNIDSYRNPTTKNELYLVRESKVERILSDNASINRFGISEAIANCLEMIYDNWEEDSKLYAVNTDGIFISNPKNSYPNKRDVEFKPENIGNVYQTDSKLVYFEKHYRENSTLTIMKIMWAMALFTMEWPEVVKHIDYVKWHLRPITP